MSYSRISSHSGYSKKVKNQICSFIVLFLSAFPVLAVPIDSENPSPSATASAPTARLGPQNAVMTLRFGKEKRLRTIVIGLYDSVAPQTVKNFKELIQKRFYNGLRFHRVLPHLLVQTGDPKSRCGPSDRVGTGGPGYTIPPEIRLPHVAGAVVAARLPDDINPLRLSNGSQFYVCLNSLPKLDGKYTVFGHVLSGFEIIDQITTGRTDSNDFPLDKIVIVSIALQPHGAPVVSPSGSQR